MPQRYRLVKGNTKIALNIAGRFQPPTNAHLLVVESAILQAKRMGANLYLTLDESHDQEKNPLNIDQRIRFLKILLSQSNVSLEFMNESSFLAEGYERVVDVQQNMGNPDKERLSGISPVFMRHAAKTGDLQQFSTGLPAWVSEQNALTILNAMRQGMKLPNLQK